MKNRLLFLIPQLICCLAAVKYAEGARAGGEARVFRVEGLTRPERVMVETLQGIVNRKGPRLFLLTIEEDRKWQEIYQEKYGFSFTPVENLAKLIEAFRDDISGLVLYDLNLDAEQWVAVTLAGIENLLPVTESILSGKSPGLRNNGLAEEYGFRVA